jgi:hypothetical protein
MKTNLKLLAVVGPPGALLSAWAVGGKPPVGLTAIRRPGILDVPFCEE